MPDGLSKFNYDGGKFSFFLHNNELKREFLTPKDFDFKNFYEEFPLIKELTKPYIEEDYSISDELSRPEKDEDTISMPSETTITDVNGKIDNGTIQGRREIAGF